MVGRILCFSVVASIKIAYGGGSSSVFKNALKAEELSMCTSSMIYTLYFPACGAKRTCSTRLRMSSTELLLAASSSCMLSEVPSLKDLQEWHWLQASPSGVGFSQLMVLARILAQVVLPTPRGPQNKNACANWWFFIAFFKVVVMCSCPTTVSKVCGLYFLAETINFSIQIKIKCPVAKVSRIKRL